MIQQNPNDMRILVIDDDPGVRKMLSFELKTRGYQITTASDGFEAIEKIKKEKFHLAISDVKMPKIDGVKTLEEIKKIDPDLEVIMATGFGTIEMAVNSMKKGAYDFVQKPFNLDEMFALIEKALEKGELRALIAIYQSTKAIFSTMKLESLLELVMDLIQKVLHADEGSIMLLNQQNELYIAGSLGIPDEIIRTVHLSIGERVAGIAAREKKEFLLINGLKDYPEFRGIENNSRIRSSIVCPLIFQNKLLGILNVNRTQNENNFTQSDLRNASIFAGQVAQAVQNTILYRELEVKVEELKKAYRELEETKDELVQSEKLASIGRLVSGVAHELNNPLTSVIGYAQMLLDTGVQGELREQLTVISREGERCRKIVQGLLAFARRRKILREKVHLETLIQEALKVVSLDLEKYQIKVEKKMPESCPILSGDPHQLRQVCLNIISNAIRALETKEGTRSLTISLEQTGQRLRLSFKDNGCGISPENMARVFDPFFTTKEVGEGTGLGLSLSYGIVTAHNGHLSVQSKGGQGATFVIELPIRTVTTHEADETVSPEKTPHKEKFVNLKKILLVEDEPAIQTLIARILFREGREFTKASDGQAAYSEILKQDFDLIICDYRLPKMNGQVLFEKIKKEKPKMADRFLFITGSTWDETLDQFFESNGLAYLKKPFERQKLLDAIEQRWGTSD